MKNQLVNDINAYIEYLKTDGLQISVHGKDIGGLLLHNIHTNPFCIYVKTDDNAWRKCIECQKKVLKLYEKDIHFGMCHAGVEEYVFFVNEKTFISVSGYGINAEEAFKRISHLNNQFYLEQRELIKTYDTLKHSHENIDILKIKIKPLVYMLRLLQIYIGDISEISVNTLFDSILAFVQRNYMQQITIKIIADACHCSQSTVEHIFKKHSGKSVNKFINELRINQAKKLLKTTDIPIADVSLICGFQNINYFPTIFKKHTGYTPSEYRIKKVSN